MTCISDMSCESLIDANHQ